MNRTAGWKAADAETAGAATAGATAARALASKVMMAVALAVALTNGHAEPVRPAASVETSPELRALTKKMQEEVEAGRLPSVAFALLDKGRIVHEGAVGWADRQASRPATIHTPYPLASVSKPITATAVMILSERGRIDLDEPVARALPALAPGLTGNVRQLLGHTSGLSTYARIEWADGAAPGPATGAAWPRHAFAAQPPGTLFEYANLGYGLLGELVERRSGRKLGEFLGTQLFGPLGMRDALMPGRFEQPARAARKFDAAGKPLPDTWNDTPGAGNLYASVHDLALFSAFHLAAEQASAPSTVLSAAGRRAMQRHVEPGARYDYYGGARYGLGWYVRDEPGQGDVVWHEGGMPGASTIVLMLPRRGVAAVVLINRTDANETAQALARALVRTAVPDFPDTPMDATQGMARYAGGDDLRGTWDGHLSVEERQWPWRLTFEADGTATVEFPGATGDTLPARATLKPLVKQGLVLGAFAGSLPAPGASRGPGRYLLLRLVRHADELTGALVAYSSEERLEHLLPFPARLSRRPVTITGDESGPG